MTDGLGSCVPRVHARGRMGWLGAPHGRESVEEAQGGSGLLMTAVGRRSGLLMAAVGERGGLGFVNEGEHPLLHHLGREQRW